MARCASRTIATLAVGAFLATACSSSDSSTSPTDAADSTSPSSTEAAVTTTPTTAAGPTSTSSTSAPTTTLTPTTAPAETSTTVAVATTVPSSDPSATSTVPTAPAAPPPEGAFVGADGVLLEVDVATGAPTRTVATGFSGDGVFRGGLRLSPDRQTVWFAESYEEGWFACDSSVGGIGRVGTVDGVVEIVDRGWNPDPSPDGSSVAFISSQQCLPDPENPDSWVITPGDRVVVRNLVTGDVREFVTDAPPDTYGAPGAVGWVGYAPDGTVLALVGDGRLFAIDVDGPGVIQDHPVELPAVLGFPVGVTTTDVLAVDVGDEGSSDLYAVDRGGAGEGFLASAEAFLAVGVSAGGHILLASSTPVDVASGVEATVLESGDSFLFDIDW